MEKTESPPSATKHEELDDASRMKKTESGAKDEVGGSKPQKPRITPFWGILGRMTTWLLTSREKVKETEKDEAGGSEKRQEVKEWVEWIEDLKPLLNLRGDLAVHFSSELHFRRSCEELKEALESIERLEALPRFSFKNPDQDLLELGVVFRGDETEHMLKRMSMLKDAKKGLVNRDVLEALPESIAQLNGLKQLYLSGCQGLKKLPESIGELKNLEDLDLAMCVTLKKLPKSIGELEQLEHLNLYKCSLLENLPESIGGLKGLKDLDLSSCRNLKKLPESIGELKGLKDLDLSWCRNLKKLPESIGGLNGLKVLNLHWCVNLKNLPESIGELRGLENLNLSACQQLENLPESIGQLKELKQLNLSLCLELRTLPKSIIELQKLEILKVSVNVNGGDLEGWGWQHKLMALRAQYGSAKVELKSQLSFYELTSNDIDLCEYELWQQFILSLHDDFESFSMFKTLRLENLSVKKLKSASRMYQQEKAQNLSDHLSALMWEQLLKTPSSTIKRVFEFSDTAIDLQSRERGVRIFCNMSASGHALEFHFENPESMSKVVGIGIKDSKATLTSNLETLVVSGSYFENQWEAVLVQASNEESMYDDLLVMFPHVDENKELQYSALSSREFGVGFKGSDETNVAVFVNTYNSAVCMIEVTPLLWEVGKHFLSKRTDQFVGKTEGSYLSNNNSDKEDSRGENNNSSSSHLGECSSQSNAAMSFGRSGNAPGDDGDYSDTDDEGGNGDKDKKHNPPRKANDDKRLNETVTLVFKKGVGQFNCMDRRQPIPRDLQNDALFFPKIKFEFDKKSKSDRKITISSRVHFELSGQAQPKLVASDEFGWLHDQLRICMSSREQINPASLDDESQYGLFKDFKGTPLAEIGKESETFSSTCQGTEATEYGGQLGGSVKLWSVADFSGNSSTKITNTHQNSIVKGEIIENPSNSVLPGGFTYIPRTNERRGHLEYEIMFLQPLREAIPDPAILWSDHAGRNRIRTSGRCKAFNAILRGTWIDLDDQEEAIYNFECERMLSKLHRDTTHNGYSERKVKQSFLFSFTLNHKMTHLSNIPQSGKVETDEGGQKVIVQQLLNQVVAA